MAPSAAERWVEPSPALEDGAPDGKVLSSAQVDAWRNHGFNLVDDVAPIELVEEARQGALADFPASGSAEMEIHVDYPNHTLTHPPPWDSPEAVELILYLDEEQHCGGATALVPRRGSDDPAYQWPIMNTPGVGSLPWINDRESAETHLRESSPEVAKFRAEHLYAREVRARYRVGTVLLYRHDLRS